MKLYEIRYSQLGREPPGRLHFLRPMDGRPVQPH